MRQNIRRVLAALSCAVLLGTHGVAAAAKGNYIYDAADGVASPAAEDDKKWAPTAAAVSEAALSVGGKSAVLMEQETGTVLFEKNSHEKLAIASVTKIMTLLLVAEAIDGGIIKLDETVTASATAASMGGSQIWLEQGEQMTVDELLKAATIVSANDACAALAEHLCGSIDSFVARMNERAAQLGMKDTKFLDCSGLSDDAYSSAHDVALMARELMRHTLIQKYTTVWMDTLRDGKSQLVNTNKLVRHYTGTTGLKTGTTQKAGHCLCATATRNGISFVAVILGCATTDERFGGARAMLDYGFAHYALYTPVPDAAQLHPVAVRHGTAATVAVKADAAQPLLLAKGQERQVVPSVELSEELEAPVEAGQVIGTWRLALDNKVVAEIPLRAEQSVGKMGLFCAFGRLFGALIK